MPRFTDADYRIWNVELTLDEIKRVRSQLDIDLLDVGNETLFARLVQDPELIVDVLHVVLAPQCERLDVDAVAFARGLRGDALDAAAQALLEGLVDFFPRRRREVLRAALAKTERWLDATADHARSVIESDRLDTLLDQQIAAIDQEIDRRLSARSTHSGGSSPSGGHSPASTPTE